MTFGQTVRAYRLRWAKLPLVGQEGLLRMSPAFGGVLCELWPLGNVPNEHRLEDTEYYLWWLGNPSATINSSPFLRSIRRVKQPFSVVLDQNGEKAEVGP